jgi:hypothetical protein
MLTSIVGHALTVLTPNAAAAQAAAVAATARGHRAPIVPIIVLVLIAAGVGFFLHQRRRNRGRDQTR